MVTSPNCFSLYFFLLETIVIKVVIANYGLKLSFATFLDAVGITCGNSNCTFCTTPKSFSRFEISIGNFGHLFAP